MAQRDQQSGAAGQATKSNWKVSRDGTYNGQSYRVGQTLQLTDDEAAQANQLAGQNTANAQFQRA